MADRKDALSLVRPHLLALNGYAAVEPPEALAERAGIPASQVVKLDANENPYGPSPKVAAALTNLRTHLYPDPAQVAARRAVSAYIGLPPEHIVVGSGSDEIIDLAFRSVLDPGDAVVNCTPTFGMYVFTAQVCGATTIDVERDQLFAIDVDRMLIAAKDTSVKIIIVASPNNPSGNATPVSDLRRLLDSDCLVIVDEAYVEFGAESVAPLVAEYPNLLVLRTLSKWGGLAGLRVGYGLMAPELAELLMRAKLPYNVNQAAEAALLASLADTATLNTRARQIVAERGRMFDALAGLPGLDPLPSDTNFILCRMPDGRGKAVYEGLAAQGVFVRYYARGKLADYLRISIGTEDNTDRLIVALRTTLAA